MKLWRALWSKQAAIPIAILLVGAFGTGIIFWGGFHWAMESTNNIEFCVSCHEMESTVYPEYQKSVHYSNASGVRAICSDCHVPKDWYGKTRRKIVASKELYHHMMGTIDTMEKFEDHRLELAQKVWAEMEANDSRECRNCHSWDAMDFEKQHPDASKQMMKGRDDGETCISCHKGIAHKMPDLSSGYKKLFEELTSLSGNQAKEAEKLITLQTKSFFLDKDAAKDDGKEAGKLLAATEVSVLERSGDLLKVRLEGWQQDQVDRVIYALRGQRIFEATLDKNSTDAVERLSSETDPDTELLWHKMQIEGWITQNDLLSDEEKLWDYAEELYVASCATCHSRPDPGHYLSNQWIGVLKSMKRFVSIDTEQYRFLQKYLQLNAKDTGGAGNHE
ncbi:NapC/NirT family cytochrome c [uncultured Cohaesibacter sp.]|uniref:NapC/NirT family cytochrome c n=1 Tax=uncultured Cohaesibacter sp. TaxID=1002546 RepID=UPI0029C6CBCE|nr:NapC/NirT family cytochrome c [uncultured Cohaesibacter sp.]